MDAVEQAAHQALQELYGYHDTDVRFTRRLDAVKAYIEALEAAVTAALVPEPIGDASTEEPAAPAEPVAGDPDPELLPDAPLPPKGRKK